MVQKLHTGPKSNGRAENVLFSIGNNRESLAITFYGKSQCIDGRKKRSDRPRRRMKGNILWVELLCEQAEVEQVVLIVKNEY